MPKRKIVKIDEEKCNGCGKCIPACPEGALQVIGGKARLVSDLFCDGLGACLGECPFGAITIEERQAEPYDEGKVMKRIAKQGENVILAHLQHLRDHGEEDYLNEAIAYLKEKGIKNPLKEKVFTKQPEKFCGCPGAKMTDFRSKSSTAPALFGREQKSELRQWSIQLTLVPLNARYFDGADLLIAADCAAFAYSNFHQDFLKGKSLIIGCPKLDDIEFYKEKLTEILKLNKIKNVTVVHMEVPCCFGLEQVVREAIQFSGKNIPLVKEIISIGGEETRPND